MNRLAALAVVLTVLILAVVGRPEIDTDRFGLIFWILLGALIVIIIGVIVTLRDEFEQRLAGSDRPDDLPKPSTSDEPALIRVAHTSSDTSNVDVYVDNSLAFSNVAFDTVTSYDAFPAGRHAIKVVPSGQSEPVLAQTDLDLAPGSLYSFAAIGEGADLELLTLSDQATGPDGELANVRFVHASPNAPAVDIAVADGGRTLVSGLSFKESSDYLTVDSGIYNLEARRAGTDEVIATLPSVVLGDETVHTIFATRMGDVTTSSVDVDVDLPDASLAVPGVAGAALGLSGGVDAPDVDIDVPSVDVDLPRGDLPDAPTIDIDVPDVDIDVPSVDMELDVPSVDVDIDAPTVDVDVPDVAVDVDVPSVDVDIDAPNVDVPDVGMAVPAVAGLGAALGLSGDADTPDVEVPTLRLPDVDIPDVGMIVPAVTGIGAAFALRGDVDVPDVDVDIDAPSVDIDAPEVDVDAPSVDIDAPEVDVDLPSVDMELEAPDVDVDIDAPTLRVPDVDIPDVGMAIPAVAGIGAALGLERRR